MEVKQIRGAMCYLCRHRGVNAHNFADPSHSPVCVRLLCRTGLAERAFCSEALSHSCVSNHHGPAAG